MLEEGAEILVTGGAGYIGSHTVVELITAGYKPVVMDNLSNSSEESLKRCEKITGKTIPFYKIDMRDADGVRGIFKKHPSMKVVMHFAGLKAVGESCEKPLEYFQMNVGGSCTLFSVMREFGCKNIIFSSSATVYGEPQSLPLTEDHPVGNCPNPYGNTKFMIEIILSDLHKSDPEWNVILLRYFNPIGAHRSGSIGEDPKDIPNNLMPYVAQVAVGKRPHVNVFGSDYDTPDGTGVRDYIHVVDLAIGHVAALKVVKEKQGRKAYNLGTGNGYSVLQMVKALEKASGKEVPYKIVGRRAGDVATCYANPGLALKELGWKAERELDEMCVDTWRWQSQNPNGYDE